MASLGLIWLDSVCYGAVFVLIWFVMVDTVLDGLACFMA